MATSRHTCVGPGSCEGCYANGESNVEADYNFWFHDILDLPDSWANWECKGFLEELVSKHVDTEALS